MDMLGEASRDDLGICSSSVRELFFCGTIALRRVGVLEMSIPIYM